MMAQMYEKYQKSLMVLPTNHRYQQIRATPLRCGFIWPFATNKLPLRGSGFFCYHLCYQQIRATPLRCGFIWPFATNKSGLRPSDVFVENFELIFVFFTNFLHLYPFSL